MLALHSLDVRSASIQHPRAAWPSTRSSSSRGSGRCRTPRIVRARSGARARRVAVAGRAAARQGARLRPRSAAAADAARRRCTGSTTQATDATVLEFRTDDAIGLLYRVTAALERCGVDIRSARVSSLGGAVVDAFYVTDGRRADRSRTEPALTSSRDCVPGHRPWLRSDTARARIFRRVGWLAGNLNGASRANAVPADDVRVQPSRSAHVSGGHDSNRMTIVLRRAACAGSLRPAVRVRLLRRRLPRRPHGTARATRSSRSALTALHNLDHRGAAGAEPSSGDGAGMTVQVPDGFLREVVGVRAAGPRALRRGDRLPARSTPRRPPQVGRARRAGREPRRRWPSSAGGRCPTDPDGLGPDRAQRDAAVSGSCSSPAPTASPAWTWSAARSALRKVAERRARDGRARAVLPVAVGAHPRLQGDAHHRPARRRSSRTCADERFASAIGLVHSRFSTNTFPSWPLAHPFRYIAHNGEINTIRGNRNWMRTRRGVARVRPDPGRPDRLFPICTPDGERLGVVRRGARAAAPGRPQPAARGADDDPRGVGERTPTMDPARRDVLRVPRVADGAWDGPACVNFTDGTVIGAVLDRNGLRPGRWWQTSDGLVVLGSESGVLDIDPATVVAKGRLQPGRMFLVDTARGEIVPTRRSRPSSPPSNPYGEWLHAGLIELRGPAQARARRVHATSRSPGASRSSATPRRSCASCSPRWRPAESSRSARWERTRRWRRCRSGPACCSTTSPSCSRR